MGCGGRSGEDELRLGLGLGAHRPAEEPALPQVGTDRPCLVGHLLVLDPLGDDQPALQVGQLGERAGDVRQVGDGRGLARALCPAASQVWLAIGRVRAARPLSMQAVGLWPDGKHRHCAALSYEWRGEWATRPPGGGGNP